MVANDTSINNISVSFMHSLIPAHPGALAPCPKGIILAQMCPGLE